MIEFSGYLSGNAEKFFWTYSRRLTLKILFSVLIGIFLPTFLVIAVKTKYWELLLWYAISCTGIYLSTFIPQPRKDKENLTPKKITLDDTVVTCYTKKAVESKLIIDAKYVADYGDFYFIVFPFGNISDKFVCQKNLITK